MDRKGFCVFVFFILVCKYFGGLYWIVVSGNIEECGVSRPGILEI